MNILISAVGGQGALLASRVLGRLAQNIGLDVKVSEVHGMSQRGGSVVTFVRFGEKIYSPIVEDGTADVVLAFELLEGARYVDWLKENGSLIVSTQRIDPMPVITGEVQYPDNLISEFSKLPIKLYFVDAVELASEAGNIKATNMVLIGILASTTTIAKEKWEEAIRETVPTKLLQINLRAFKLGYKINSN
jgi:indolepyruvate ferredoxin oxidoreductase beta subunit